MVVYSHRQAFFRLILTDNVIVEDGPDFTGPRHVTVVDLHIFAKFFFDDLIAQLNAFVANVYSRTCDELFYLFLSFSAKRAFELALFIAKLKHYLSPSSPN